MPNSRPYTSHSLAETQKYGAKIVPLLKRYRILTLHGDLGSGKTALASSLGQALKITETLTSPTFALSHRHPLPDQKTHLWHWDLYRIHSPLEAQSLGFFDEIHHPHTLHLIEWPEKIYFYLPRPFLHLDCASQSNGTHIFQHQIINLTLPDQSEIQALYDQYELPANIREHCRLVGEIAGLLAQKMQAQDERVNPQLARTAGLLHDLLRPLDFLPERVKPAQQTLYQKLKRQFPHQRHEQAAKELLTELGYPELGHTIGEHRFEIIGEPTYLPLTLEGLLLNYADKRVRHAEIVSLTERFADGRIRNAHLLSPNIDQLEAQYFQIEKNIFTHLDITPDQLSQLIQ